MGRILSVPSILPSFGLSSVLMLSYLLSFLTILANAPKGASLLHGQVALHGSGLKGRRPRTFSPGLGHAAPRPPARLAVRRSALSDATHSVPDAPSKSACPQCFVAGLNSSAGLTCWSPAWEPGVCAGELLTGRSHALRCGCGWLTSPFAGATGAWEPLSACRRGEGLFSVRDRLLCGFHPSITHP